ncbi:MobV family relaxase [Sporosarcina sp. NCCP-2378]|uniref:MobV family relaxase n=2 Tax=unclassified Sporosarcina TaxID=2647733 RepID=UPI00222E241A|nr:MobV family relaxase [Sporosarcina sp. NCCP-2378]GLB57822.1 Plasmid recombination enzyme type 2 [Sporosarcina sp. NCCP-2378]
MARYAIIRVQKFKMSDVQGIQKHNQRQGKSKSNLDIDYERSHLNVDLLNEQNLRYEQTLKNEISERVKRKPRANSVVLSEFLVTASPEYMQSLSADEQKRYFERSLDFIKGRYGEQNTLYAVVHMDEANPHMHVGIVPITEDGRLSAKDLYNRTELRQLQKEFPAEMQRQGFEVERGEEGSKEKHLHPNEYKEKKDLEKEVQLLEKNLEGKKEELLALNETVPVKVKFSAKKEMEEVEVESKEKNLFGRPKKKIQRQPTGNIIVSEPEFKRLLSAVKENERMKNSVQRFLRTDLAKENQELEGQIDLIYNEWKEKNEENQQLKAEVRELRLENRSLKERVSDLRQEIVLLYKSSKEFLRERTGDVRAFKSAFKDLVDKVREKITGSEFENIHKRELRKERDRGLER